jgi:Photosynthesis system II assembly factor YCF48
MATDERDAMFEKALARQLRGGASGDLRGATANCPDAEILGAYHEQSLTAAEMAECARHIPGCARCQEILSQLEATEEVSMGTSADEDGKQARELRALPMALPRAKPASRRATRYWAAPLGAIAAGLVVWLGVNYEKEAHTNQKAAVEVAQNRESAPIEEKKAPAAASAMDTTGNALREGGAGSRGDLVAQKQESTGRDEKSLAKELPAATKLRTPRMVAPASPLPRVETRSGVGGGDASGSGAGAATGSAGAKIVPPAATTESVEVTADAPPLHGATDAAPKPAAPPAVPSVTQTVTVVGAAAPVAQAEAGEITTETHTMQSLPIVGRNVSDLMLLTPGVLAISAPGGNILWRVGHGGSVESSKDGGAHWKKQKSHVKADLSGGFAPSAEICWIVGPGTILRSVDGGAHWKKRASPIAGEIAGISAMDAQHATIWDADKKNMFVTADGGVSWSAVAHN